MSLIFRRAVLAATHNPIAQAVFTRTPAGRALALRFVAGETLEDAIEVSRRLNAARMSLSLDHLGEEVRDVAMAEAARDDYLACLRRIGEDGIDGNISVKLTQLGLAIDADLARRSLGALADAAADVGTTVTIDMEDSRYTQATIDLYRALQPEKGNLGIAVQAYLHRTPDDLERLIPLGGHIRLTKGAYAEPPEIALQSKEDIDEAFARLLERLMAAEETMPAIATHDDRLIAKARLLAAEREGPYEFQMLYGVREPLQRELVDAGEPLRIYVPYGSEWYPYLTRRLAERPANLRFFMRALVGLTGR